MTVKEDVDEAIKTYPILIYSKSYCPYCRRAKELLASIKNKAAEPKIYEIDLMGSEGLETQQYLLESTGQRTVPNIFIGHKHIGGSDDLASLHAMGGLEPLVTKPMSQAPPQFLIIVGIVILISAAAWFGRRFLRGKSQPLPKEKL